MVNIAVFASGSGTNFENIVLSNNEQLFNIKLLIVDKENAFAIQRAIKLNVPYVYINPKQFSNKEEYEKEVEKYLIAYDIGLIVLAGYLRIISSYLLNKYPNRIINIHPSLLPKYPGKRSIKDVYDAKESITGVTIHYVDEGIDTGISIAQDCININPDWTLEELELKVHELEYKLYPEVIKAICQKIMEEKFYEKSAY